MPELKTVDTSLVAQIIRSYVSHNGIPVGELSNLIAIVYRSLAELGTRADTPAPKGAIAINRSYGRDFVVCLDCGWRGQMLKRHLTTAHALSTDDYRARWNLKGTHPLTAPAYTQRRSTIAKQIGLGRSPQPASMHEPDAAPPAAASADTGLDPAFVASLSQPRRRGRPRATPAATTA
jgi:predicted transcriptional regulator